jgi:hypothetical protein
VTIDEHAKSLPNRCQPATHSRPSPVTDDEMHAGSDGDVDVADLRGEDADNGG